MSYLDFVEVIIPNRKTKVWNIFNKKSDTHLGSIAWYSHWRKYCVMFDADTLYDSNCLKEISEFLDKVNEAHKNENPH